METNEIRQRLSNIELKVDWLINQWKEDSNEEESEYEEEDKNKEKDGENQHKKVSRPKSFQE